MSVRRESVEISVTDTLGDALIRDAAAAALLNRELANLNRNQSAGLRRLSADADAASRRMTDASARIRQANDDLDKNSVASREASQGMGGLMQAALLLSPALVPIGAAAVAPIAALTAGLGAATGAFAVTLAAVHGLGDGLKALNTYQLEPTAENLAKAQGELQKLGPAGAQFVVFLDKLGPQLSELQNVARQGIFPGVEDGIDSLLSRTPELKTFVQNMSDTVGDLAADAGANLAGPKFDAFFDYITNRGGPILRDFAEAAGNVGEAFANMLIAFDPVTASFSGGLLNMSRAFAQWSRGLDENQGFQHFLAYVQESGPRTLDFIGSLIHALSGIVTAAQPVGDVILPILTDVANAIGTIANSDFGAPFITALVAVRSFNLLLGTTRSLIASTTAVGGASGALGFGRAGQFIQNRATGIGNAASGTLIYGLSGAYGAAAKSAGQLALETGKAAAPVAALALLSTGAAGSMGVTNTATLALAGTMGGGFGIAIGAGVGALLDLKKAGDNVTASIDAVNKLLDSTASFGDKQSGLQSFSDQAASASSLQDHLRDSGLTGITTALAHPIAGLRQGFDDIFGKTTDADRLNAALGAANQQLQLASSSAAGLGRSLGLTIGPLDGSTRSANELTAALQAAGPAMQDIGISPEQLTGLKSLQDVARGLGAHPHQATAVGAAFGPDVARTFKDQLGDQVNTYDEAVDRIMGKFRTLNSTAGQQHALADAIAGIGSAAKGGVEPVDALTSALDKLLSPRISLRDSAAQFSDQLRGLKNSLADNPTLTTGLLPVGPADSKNRQAIDALASGLQDLLDKQAAVDPVAAHLTKTFEQQRQAIVDQATTMGLRRKDVEAYLSTLKLAKGDVRTVVDLVIAKARANAQLVLSDFAAIPKDVRAEIRADGIPQTLGQVDDLVARYKLTEGQRKTLIKLEDDAAKAGLASFRAAVLAATQPKSQVITISTVHHGGLQPGFASGGITSGPSGPSDLPADLMTGAAA